MVTVCERLFLPMRAVGLEKCDVIYQILWQ
jgi:hypothetical protein